MAANGSTVTSVYDALQRVRQGGGLDRPLPGARLRRRDEAVQPARAPGPFAAELTPLLATVRPLLADGRGAVLHFVAAAGGEGASTMAREFALLAATIGGRRTLLIDAARDPVTARHFGCDTTHGLIGGTCVGFDDLDLLHQVPGTLLSVASLVGEQGNASADAVKLSGLYDRLREQFELVVLDCPAIEHGEYSTLLPEEADGIFLVIRAEATRPAVVAHAKALVEQGGGRFLGAVLNRRQNYIPDFLYRLL